MPAAKALSYLALVLFTLNANANTTVYKKVMPDGSISFSDEAQSGAETIEVGPVTTVPAITPQLNEITDSPNESSADVTSGYTSLSITTPSHNSAFNSGSGTVDISVSASPSLRNSDRFKFFLGRELLSEQQGTTLTINNVSRGSHELSVHIVDRSGKVLKTTTNTFTIHRPKVKRARP